MKGGAYVFCFVVIDTCKKFDTKFYAANTQKGKGGGAYILREGASDFVRAGAVRCGSVGTVMGRSLAPAGNRVMWSRGRGWGLVPTERGNERRAVVKGMTCQWGR